VNLPLSPVAAVRLVGWDEHDAGYINNVAASNPSACIVNGVRTSRMERPICAGQRLPGRSRPIIHGPARHRRLSGPARSARGLLKDHYNRVTRRGVAVRSRSIW